jgi:hypothetical protein
VQTFYLGAHRYNWACDGLTDQSLFISDRTLRRRVTPFAPAVTRWALDSGGFTELSQNRLWTVSPAEYAQRVRRYQRELGLMDFAAQQDWMCEPEMLAHNGLSVVTHQSWTITNYLELRELAPEVPWAPTVQGWSLGDYWRHVEEWYRRGVELHALPVVCVGSVCRRENPASAANILSSLAADGLSLHAFGVKAEVLALCHEQIQSSDSMAWSTHMRAERNAAKKAGLPYKHLDPNSLTCGLQWVDKTINRARGIGQVETDCQDETGQLEMFEAAC